MTDGFFQILHILLYINWYLSSTHVDSKCMIFIYVYLLAIFVSVFIFTTQINPFLILVQNVSTFQFVAQQNEKGTDKREVRLWVGSCIQRYGERICPQFCGCVFENWFQPPSILRRILSLRHLADRRYCSTDSYRVGEETQHLLFSGEKKVLAHIW